MINKDIDTATVTDRHQYAVAVLCDAGTVDHERKRTFAKVPTSPFTFKILHVKTLNRHLNMIDRCEIGMGGFISIGRFNMIFALVEAFSVIIVKTSAKVRCEL